MADGGRIIRCVAHRRAGTVLLCLNRVPVLLAFPACRGSRCLIDRS